MPFGNNDPIPKVEGTFPGRFDGRYVLIVLLTNPKHDLLSAETLNELYAKAGERPIVFVTKEILERYPSIIQILHKKATP